MTEEERLREAIEYCSRVASKALNYDTHQQSSHDMLFTALWRIEQKTELVLKEVEAKR